MHSGPGPRVPCAAGNDIHICIKIMVQCVAFFEKICNFKNIFQYFLKSNTAIANKTNKNGGRYPSFLEMLTPHQSTSSPLIIHDNLATMPPLLSDSIDPIMLITTLSGIFPTLFQYACLTFWRDALHVVAVLQKVTWLTEFDDTVHCSTLNVDIETCD